MSSDFEDIVFILENRSSIWEEMEKSDSSLKKYLKKEFKNFVDNHYIAEWIGSHLGTHSSATLILQELDEFLSK